VFFFFFCFFFFFFFYCFFFFFLFFFFLFFFLGRVFFWFSFYFFFLIASPSPDAGHRDQRDFAGPAARDVVHGSDALSLHALRIDRSLDRNTLPV